MCYAHRRSQSEGNESNARGGGGKDALTTAANTVLVTDGMDKHVCVHDFSVDHNDDEADFELEMPEYRNGD